MPYVDGAMIKKLTTAVTLASVGAFASTTTAKPKITMAQARATALKKAPGTIKSEELEN